MAENSQYSHIVNLCYCPPTFFGEWWGGQMSKSNVRDSKAKTEGDRIPTGRLIAYAQLVMPLAIIGLPITIYIPPFYSGTLGLDLAAVGIVLMVARFSDVITDPLIGRLSDRTRTRFGRRRPWIIAGIPIMLVSSYMLFLPVQEVSLAYLLVWIAAIYFGFTLIGIPYGAWGAEMSGDYRERTRITGAREIFLIIGLLMAIAAPIVGASIAGGERETSETLNSASREAMGTLGWLTLVVLPISALILFAFVKETKHHIDQKVSFKDGVKAVMRNGPFRRILVSSMAGALATSLNVSVAILFFDHVLKLGDNAFVLILILFVATLLGAPIWVALGNRISKHRALCFAAFFSLSAFAMVPFVVYVLLPNHPEDVFSAMLAITLVQGIAGGATAILGTSMLADVVDLDMMRTGEQRTGLLFAFLGMVRKMFEAGGVGIALPFIAFMGFSPQLEAQSETGILGIMLMYCIAPLCLWLLSLAVIWNFPLTAERHARIRAAYERKIERLDLAIRPAPGE
jgi:glycoside/pentoside/hexuronide:cation symporter, GPH family